MRAGKSILAWAAALMMIANPAWAGRWHSRSCGPAYCGPAYCGPAYCGSGYYAPSYCEPVYCESSCGTNIPSDCAGCEVQSGEPTTTNHLPEAAPPSVTTEPATPQPTFEPG